MKSAVPKVSQTARVLLLNVQGLTGSTCSSSSSSWSVATALQRTAQYATFSQSTAAAAAGGGGAAAGGKPPGPGRSPAPALAKQPAAAPKPAAAAADPKPEATAAAAQQAAGGGAPEAASSSSSSSSNTGGDDGGKGSSWLATAALLALPAGTYYYYQHQKDQYMKEQGSNPQPAVASLDSLLKGGKQLVGNITNNIPDMSQISNAVKGAGKKLTEQADKLTTQKHQDEESGFKILPPEAEDTAAAAAAGHLAAADDAAAAAAAARDSMSAAADEFPGSTEGAAAAGAAAEQAAAAAAAVGQSVDLQVEHVDITPIRELFSVVSDIDYSGSPSSSSSSSSTATTTAAPSSSSSSATPAPTTTRATAEDAERILASLAAVAAAQQQQQPAAATAKGAEATAPAAAAAAEYHSDSELDQLCRKLGLKRDLTPAGLIGAANAAGLGAYSSSSGTPLPAQVAQLHQASADARLLGDLLTQLVEQQEGLQQQLTAAHREKDWAEQAAKKREESLTEHFKELLREQSRIAQSTTAAAVKKAQELLLADLTAAQLQERQQRLAAADELRAKVNALALAFEQRTSQVRSAHDVNKISVGVAALSRALEEGTPIAHQLQNLAVGCPNDAVVAAVASSLPPSAATDGLPTLQQLQQQFSGVATAAAEAAYFTAEGEGGVLARAAAKLAVKLKVNAGVSSSGPDKSIQQAQELLQQGKLLAAADTLSAAAAGTQAAAVVQQWVAAARARAVADQAVKLLQAHATTTAVAAQL